MLIDRAKIYVSGGRGGNGCNSLYKDIFHRKGIPDGGDGGSGGDIIIGSDPNLQTLLDFKYNQHYRAGKGKHGSSNKKFGRSGEDRLVRVPVGTLIKDVENDLVLKDLAKAGEKAVVARGGSGGIGNAKGREATEGTSGEERVLLLELKLVADVVVIGFPNAGKSTIVSRISKIHTKIAPYPFTTKNPKLGVVRFDDDAFVVADMPGLIEGAHKGKGLGDKFLRHIERTVALAHVVDIAPLDDSDPAENYFKLEKELELYGHDVAGKPRVIVVNKMDMPLSNEKLENFKRAVNKEVVPVSAIEGKGLKELVSVLYKKVRDVKKKVE